MKPKLSQVDPVHTFDEISAPKETTEPSNRDKILQLFWIWEQVYRFNGLFMDWPGLSGRQTSLRAGRVWKVLSSIHSVLLFLLAVLNCFRYAPYFVTFTSLTSQNSVIIFFTFIFSSAMWFYATHIHMMARDFCHLAHSLASVFQTLGVPPKVRHLKRYVAMYMSSAIGVLMVSIIPLYMEVFHVGADGTNNGSLLTVRLLPTQANTTAHIIAAFLYGYVCVFMYIGFFTLISYIIFFCYIIGHAFGEITQRLQTRADRFIPYLKIDPINPDHSGKDEFKPGEESPGKSFTALTAGVNRSDSIEDSLNKTADQYLQGSAIQTMTGLLEVTDDLDVEILHLHKSNISQDARHPSVKQLPVSRACKTPAKPGSRHVNHACVKITNTTVHEESRIFLTNTSHAKASAHKAPVPGTHLKKWNNTSKNENITECKTQCETSQRKQKKETPQDFLLNNKFTQNERTVHENMTDPVLKEVSNSSESEQEERTTKKNESKWGKTQLNDLAKPFDCEIEYLRYHHFKLMENIMLGDKLIGSVVFTVYWQGVLMACFSLYSLVTGAFPRSELSTLALSLLAVTIQTTCCTSCGAWLNDKACEQEMVLLQLNACSLTDPEFRSLSVFLSQVRHQHIGITAFGFLPVNRSTYLTIVGTIITYAVVVLQFNSNCQVYVTNSTSVTSS